MYQASVLIYQTKYYETSGNFYLTTVDTYMKWMEISYARRI